jgi:hypothetical protein
MPNSLVIPKRLPVCPNRDSRFTIRHHSGNWWVHYKAPDGTFVPADHAHEELVVLVNGLKEAEGNAAGGAFSINERGQVIARMKAPPGYPQNAIHVVDISAGAVQTYNEIIFFGAGAIDPTATPSEGSPWTGPRCGSSYSFASPNNKKPPSHNLNEIWTEIDNQDDLLSVHLKPASYPPPTGQLAQFLAALRRQLPLGGRFRVNEHGRAFTADSNLFIGQVPLTNWFPALSLTS